MKKYKNNFIEIQIKLIFVKLIGKIKMITKSNFKNLLSHLEFQENKNIFSKKINGHELKVDFSEEKIIYPNELRVNENQTTNLEKPENYVVFECVNRLLEKGYRPEHIELEKRWSLGHTQKSGRADICVYDHTGERILLIIECKTFGAEYKKALKILKDDGGQLFSYWQQAQSAEWLSLYASDFSEEGIIYHNDIISGKDDENLLLLSKKDATIKLYKNAQKVDDLFEVWRETYNQKLWEGLIFGEETTAYKIGIRPLRKKDLKDFSPEDKIINQFEEILRHNNISDKENAFNRLIALFICKMVDEISKNDNTEVDFQYKQGTDTYETLQDRLQKLYKIGMDKFMKEEIFYVSSDYATELFAQYQGGERKKAIEDLQSIIRKLKFYSNNDFSFKDVHNEKLFLQNGKILVEMVQLFEKYRIVYPSKHQFLGDLFEQLLNKGFKQNEGQFFTPMPITRFIWDSLPLQKIIENNGGDFPKVIDYACGSGHFLTEAIEAINTFLTPKNNDWVRDKIFGIEKDYRLARVSKVSMFMNGAGESNIIFGDGLDNDSAKNIENNQFDILVANPPYSVSAFKSHLKLAENQLKLLDKISNNGSEIEVLFCERISQLLKPKGVGAVILPSSILSNDSGSYTGAREHILQEFLIKAIITLGSKTFGATGTNTVVLFLEKRPQPPKKQELVWDSVNAIFDNTNENKNIWNDEILYQKYVGQIEVSKAIYDDFLGEKLSLTDLEKNDYFKQYKDKWEKLTETQKRKTAPAFKKLEKQEQEAELKKRCYAFIREIEREKMYYFALTFEQNTLIITAPADNNKQKEFLGYDWSNRKGAEGIVMVNEGGKLYHATDRRAKNTLAHYVRKSFDQETISFAEDLQEFAKITATADMLDFSRTEFNKALRTSIQKKIEIKSKFPLKTIEEITIVIESGKRPSGGVGNYKEGAYSLGGEHIGKDNGRLELKDIKFVPMTYFNEAKRGIITKNDILICKDGALTGKVCVVRDELDNIPAMINEHIFLLRCENINTQMYLFNYLYSEMGQALLKANITGSAQGGLNSTNLKNIKIPLPPLSVQEEIVKECEKIDEEYENSRMKIEDYRARIAQIFHELGAVEKNIVGGG